jgi:hypothetical protein
MGMLGCSLGSRLRHCFITGGCCRDGREFLVRIAASAGFALALTFATLFGATTTLAGPIALVTLDEVRAEAQARIEKPPRTRSLPTPGAPKIQVLQPEISVTPLQNPIRIELQFSSASDADIDPASFRAYYGFLRFDITERIVKSVRVTKSGLKIENAEIPPGSHRLFLRIADSKERATETEVRFVVE